MKKHTVSDLATCIEALLETLPVKALLQGVSSHWTVVLRKAHSPTHCSSHVLLAWLVLLVLLNPGHHTVHPRHGPSQDGVEDKVPTDRGAQMSRGYPNLHPPTWSSMSQGLLSFTRTS